MQRTEHEHGRATYRVSRPNWREAGYQLSLRLAMAIVLALVLTITIIGGYL